ncbi:MAG: OmpW family outer membrane protein [Pseudomonadota bacterium]
MKTKFLMLAAAAGAAAFASPAMAQEAGDIQLKVVATAVLPEGDIESIPFDNVPLPADFDTAANDNVVPTLAVEYFLTDSFSIETIAGTTQHDVDAFAGLPGAEIVSDGLLLPATFTGKFHFDAGGIKPYVGAGGAYFIWLDADPGAGIVPLGVTDVNLSDELGLVLQAGVDVPLGDNGFGLTLDAKRYFIDTTLTVFVDDTLILETEHSLDPWVLSAGVSFTF